MADVNSIRKQAIQQGQQIGRAALNSLFPKDFEYYYIGLELVNSDDRTIDYLGFPVMPSSISKTETSRVNIKKGLNSVVVLNNKSFSPQDLTIKGNFGRDFKIVLDPIIPTVGKAFNYSIKNKVYSLDDMDPQNTAKKSVIFNPFVKTGYGVIKILQAIINKAQGEDEEGKPFKLFFYNPALGENYLVVPPQNALTLTQDDQQSNMVWNYTLNLTIVSPIDFLRTKMSMNSVTNIAQNIANKSAKELKNSVIRKTTKLLLA